MFYHVEVNAKRMREHLPRSRTETPGPPKSMLGRSTERVAGAGKINNVFCIQSWSWAVNLAGRGYGGKVLLWPLLRGTTGSLIP